MKKVLIFVLLALLLLVVACNQPVDTTADIEVVEDTQDEVEPEEETEEEVEPEEETEEEEEPEEEPEETTEETSTDDDIISDEELNQLLEDIQLDVEDDAELDFAI